MAARPSPIHRALFRSRVIHHPAIVLRKQSGWLGGEPTLIPPRFTGGKITVTCSEDPA